MKYYLYRHIRLDKYQPFYVGIGTQRRSFNYERAYKFTKRNKRWTSIYKNTNIKVEIMLESDDVEYIKSKEIYFIKLYGREDKGGILANYTNGGDGIEGFKVSEKTKKILSELNKGKNHPQYNTKASIITRKKQSLAKIGIKNKLSKRVICLNNNKIYDSYGEAANDIYGDRKLSKKISDVICKRRKKYKGYSFVSVSMNQSFDDRPHVELIKP